MTNFVSFDDFDNLLCRVCSDCNLDLSQVLGNKLENFGIIKKTIQTWSELDNLDENELFETENYYNSDQKIYLINFENLTIDKNSVQFLTNFIQKNEQKLGQNSKKQNLAENLESKKSELNQKNQAQKIYLYSQNLTSSDKTLFKKHKIITEELKITENIKIDLATKLSQKTGLNLTKSEIEKLVFETTSLTEIINKLDFLNLTENPKKYLENLCKIPETLLFTISLDKIQKWHTLVDENNLQLALSLILGKLEKKNPKLVKLVVQTDKRIKTRGGIKPILWWKMLLWQLDKEI